MAPALGYGCSRTLENGVLNSEQCGRRGWLISAGDVCYEYDMIYGCMTQLTTPIGGIIVI